MNKVYAVLALLIVANVATSSIITGDAVEAMKASAAADGGQIYAVLVAGSNTWSNYRHQADVCHSYQVLHSHGVPDSNIIVMMWDDLAQSSSNPTKGILINEPNGPDVYKGVPKDYIGKDVSSKNFVDILKGTGSGKVLKSGPNDHVFVLFVDHGGVGLVCFGSNCGDKLSSKTLHETLVYMNENHMYSKLVLYIEACESGSMFNGVLENNMNIYGISTANPYQSSYATYYDAKYKTYLGEVTTCAWLQDADAHSDLSVETLQDQYNVAAHKTDTSVPCQYGDLSIASLAVSLFMGNKTSTKSARTVHGGYETVSSHDVSLSILEKTYAETKSETVLAELIALRAERRNIDKQFEIISESLSVASDNSHSSMADDDWYNGCGTASHCNKSCPCMSGCYQGNCSFLCCDVNSCNSQKPDDACLEQFYDSYEAHCGTLSFYALKYSPIFAQACIKSSMLSKNAVDSVMSRACN